MWIWLPENTHLPRPDVRRADVPRLPFQLLNRRTTVGVQALTAWSSRRPIPTACLSGVLLCLLGAVSALSLEPPSASHVLLSKGWQSLERGQFEESARLFEEATAGHPTHAMTWVGLALSAWGLHEDVRVEQALTIALQLNPSFAEAHRLLGRFYLEADRPDLAVRHFDMALRQDPSNVSLAGELRHAQEVFRHDARLRHLATPHFVVKFEGAQDLEQAGQLVAYLDEARHAVQERVAYTPVTPVIVVLHGQDTRVGPTWAEGLFDGRLHVSLSQLAMPRERLQAYLTHEYAHAVIHRLSRGRAPTWLNEGLAQVLEQAAATRPVTLKEGDRGKPIWLDALQGDFAGLTRAEAERRYADSRLATFILIQRHGLAGITRWLKTLAVSKDLAQAYERVFDRPYPSVLTP